ncbi:hypothetical protein LTS08_000149 [Lithohypha guttulata]|nr:hypothetical protein LTS08_000149 [Lithohypha guttulata]
MFYEIAIIGAGPCGLAVAARLREKTPSALFTNDEHARYWKKHKQRHNSIENERKKRKPSTDSGYVSESQNVQGLVPEHPSMIVLDAGSCSWLSTWKQSFRSLEISHLRSPLFFHFDPRDKDGLLAFAHEHNRTDELLEIPSVVGKELSKHEKKKQHTRRKKQSKAPHLKIDGRDQIDYFTPSSKLFEDYCEHIIERYKLRNVVHQAEVLEISYDGSSIRTNSGSFTIKTGTNSIIYTKIVIVATGPSTTPIIPGIPRGLGHSGMNHVFHPGGTDLPPALHSRITTTSEKVTIVIIGGGLTSAQLVHLLLDRYHKHTNLKLHLLLRHPSLKVKPFDVTLPWVSKIRNHLMASFYSADSDDERLAMLLEARNGGSITPYFAKMLRKHETEGRLKIHASTELKLCEQEMWNTNTQTWTNLRYQNKTSDGENFLVQDPTARGLPDTSDHIIFCTSSAPSLPQIPFLRKLAESHPIVTLSGLPVPTEDLAWSSNVPLFFTGALAALRLGPGAANLMGARVGAERIAWVVEAMLGKRGGRGGLIDLSGGGRWQRDGSTSEDNRRDSLEDRSDFTGSFSNQYAALSLSDSQ